MGKFEIRVESQAQTDLLYHQKAGNQRDIKRIEKIITELSVTPFVGIGRPEGLKYELSGYWSRLINNKDRIVYRVEENIVFIVSARGHYLDR